MRTYHHDTGPLAYADEVRPTENAKCGDLFREVVGEKNPQSNTPPQGRTAEKEI